MDVKLNVLSRAMDSMLANKARDSHLRTKIFISAGVKETLNSLLILCHSYFQDCAA